jgi:hypothetical protein
MNKFKKRLWIMACGSLLASIGISHSAYAANNIQHFKQKGSGASAQWDQSDDCSYSSTSVYVSETETLGASGDSAPFVSVWVNTYNSCNGTSHSISGYSYADIQFNKNPGFKPSTLVATIPASVCTYNYNTDSWWGAYTCEENHTIDVNLTWTPTEHPTHSHSHYSYGTPTYKFSSHSVGSTAPATVSGTVKQDGSLDLITGSLTYGQVYSDHSGSIYLGEVYPIFVAEPVVAY